MYKYFLEKDHRVLECVEVLDPQYFSYPELSQAQYHFMDENPNASFNEVKTCKLYEPMPIIPINLDTYKAQRLDELNRLSLANAGRLSSSYARENAKISLDLILLIESGIATTQEPIYTKEKSIEIITEANRIGSICRNERYRITELINQANFIEEVDAAYNSNEYDTIVGVNNTTL